MKFYKVKFTDTSSAGKAVGKISKMLRSFNVSLEFESFKSVKYSWCCEFFKVGSFSGSIGRPMEFYYDSFRANLLPCLMKNFRSIFEIFITSF